mgnify:CR=1 FL=1
MFKYKAAIHRIPKSTWVMLENDQREEKNKLKSTLGKTTKLNSKKRKREEALAEAGNTRSYKKTSKDRSDNNTKRINKASSKGKKGKRRS